MELCRDDVPPDPDFTFFAQDLLQYKNVRVPSEYLGRVRQACGSMKA